MEFVRGKENEAKEEKEDSSGSQQGDASLEELYGILDMIELDIAIYFAETLIHNHPQLHWDYVKKRPKLYAYHQLLSKAFMIRTFFFFHGRSSRHVLPEKTVTAKTIISVMYIKSGKGM